MSAISVPQVPDRTPAKSHQKRLVIAFAIVATLLLVPAIAMQGAKQKLKLAFQKLPVEPRLPMLTLPEKIGPWVQASVDRRENPDFEHELGTERYVFRTYVDTRKLPDAERKAFIDGTIEDRAKSLANAGAKIPAEASVRFALTYYTGSADTVPHVPERCFAADGWRPDNPRVVSWAILPGEDGKPKPTDVRMMSFENQIGARKTQRQQVCYFFQVNGGYEQDPIFGVRKKLQNLFERHAYFAKIEMVMSLPEDSAAEPVMTDFLVHAMPEIERLLPDWQEVSQSDTK